MDMLIIGAAGFLITFVLLFVFAAQYRAAAAPEDVEFGSSAAPAAAANATRPQVAVKRATLGSEAANPNEVLELREKVKQLYYRIEELKLVQETKTADAAKTLAKLEQRLDTFENEYVNKLQPTLAQIIEELENIKPAP